MAYPIRIYLLSSLLLLGLVGCAGQPKHIERTPSTAFDRPETTSAGRFLQPDIEHHPGQSGFTLLESGSSAFRARNAMARIAEKTLDAQYYVWEDDDTGRMLASQLLSAAERGVRVRLLLDDVNLHGRDFGAAALDLHPNIEVRFFNPFVDRDSKWLEFATDLSRLNHRMHNKAFIMDSAFAVMGGRNIGDHYFGVSPDLNFRDLDLLVAGPAAGEIAKSFDLFWNSQWAIPVAAVADDLPTPEEGRRLRKKLKRWVADNEARFPYKIDQKKEDVYGRLEKLRHRLIWADAEIVYDDPDQKVETDTGYQGVRPRLVEVAQQATQEILIEAAYMIPREAGIDNLGSVRDRGVRVRVLTNSMATNDVAAAFVGYRRYRKELLENGVELYELRPDLGSQRKFWALIASRSTASLHSKVAVVDRSIVYIGSYNSDPRSAEINTEIALLIDSPELAEQVIQFMEVGIDPSNSFHLVLEKEDPDDSGHIVWIGEENGVQVRLESDPHAGFWRPVSAWFISFLPIEDQL